jgi:hypothetical protein
MKNYRSCVVKEILMIKVSAPVALLITYFYFGCFHLVQSELAVGPKLILDILLSIRCRGSTLILIIILFLER